MSDQRCGKSKAHPPHWWVKKWCDGKPLRGKYKKEKS